ncbi:hypothetical protein LTR84_008777 [Exophiala bonariae]|uniref:BAG domain-containing protein n=1 Tax=Exophiala bonariae TaxID=1690606 RepID=A0AAV9MZ16_9EURO|nr:hypothetical protein LTR84_008777 [Exophiala bonariae]
MESSLKPKAELSEDRILSIIQRDKEKRAQPYASWYHLACQTMPSFARYAKELFDKRRMLQGQSENKDQIMTRSETWLLVQDDLHRQLPVESSILESLQKHVMFWTDCDQDEIQNLFIDLHTEDERLDALLGRNFNIPTTPVGHIKRKHDSHCTCSCPEYGLRDSDYEYDSDDSFVFEIETPPTPKKSQNKKRKLAHESVEPTEPSKADTVPAISSSQQIFGGQPQHSTACDKPVIAKPVLETAATEQSIQEEPFQTASHPADPSNEMSHATRLREEAEALMRKLTAATHEAKQFLNENMEELYSFDNKTKMLADDALRARRLLNEILGLLGSLDAGLKAVVEEAEKTRVLFAEELLRRS